MSERDELLAIAEANHVKVDRRLGTDKLRQVIAEAGLLGETVTSRDWGGDSAGAAQEAPSEPGPDDEAAQSAPVEIEPTGLDDVWPKRIAPCAWLDQNGVRHTDMGLAYEAAEKIRRRS